jgi:argininosuccinate lyase
MAIWDSRFNKKLSLSALKFSSSIDIDKRLFNVDIDASIAHVKMLSRQKIISKSDCNKIVNGLSEIRNEIVSGKIKIDWKSEDIHSVIEENLISKIGETGKKLHTARSRNDQIAVDEKLFLRNESKLIIKAITLLQKSLLKKAISYKGTIIPGYTHLQRAQPILFSHHLLAYVEMLERDKCRFSDSVLRINLSPLGAAAFAGTSLPIDRKYAARLLKFDDVQFNSIDAVSDRDSIIETISNLSIVMMHLSRLSEELILWSSQEFSFAFFDDDFATGSSLMPQKKNPDIAELIRGKTGRVYGALIGILTLMKSLPLAYNRDMQEDKFHLLNALDTVSESISIMTELINHTSFDKNRFEKELNGDLTLSTDIADYLVRKNIPFRKAHNISGKIVAHCISQKIKLNEMSLQAFKNFSDKFEKDIFDLLNPITSIKNKKSLGSTSYIEVDRQIAYWKQILLKTTQGKIND